MKFSVASIAALLIAIPALVSAAESWDLVANAKLPTPTSDHSSTFVPASEGTEAGIYIAGGCDSPKGNTFVDADGLELDFFICETISDKLHVFDADTMTFTTSSALLPRARYRHAAVEAGGKLWLVGGRTVPEDNVIAEVDVYDPATDSWSTVGKIPHEFLTSDNGAFASPDGSTIYVVGGYNPSYFAPDALATTFSFDTLDALQNLSSNLALGNTDPAEDLVVTKRADMITGRGDIHAVSSSDGSLAYVAGGYAGMCKPLTSTEVYDIATDTWSSAGDLLKARGDGAMVEAGGTIFAIGGEVNHPDQCAAPELIPPLSHQSLAVEDVEALEYSAGTDSSTWIDVADIPEFRFRFSAASWPSTGVAYAFGGQTSFDEDCKCFPTTSEITAIDPGTIVSGLPKPGSSLPVVGGSKPVSPTSVATDSDESFGSSDDEEDAIGGDVVFDESSAPNGIAAAILLNLSVVVAAAMVL
mmetsp:Transcript_7643/g.15725  ORF Transcript_7643/g.15725 Transcript_7643/m.15725 type:complete len:472 (-) Transcript_7643:151-1566(-)|eukprot:CAMPEP_0201133188 /NCGR_PEP_ID=MMETSP0850-20130426/48116_1 /ASSEMBLY_ACC=CAM_ASM_000622 /TAXON_ID=183588 /ORGANISM="Pseudo-nitzschia fraudulenta, Strain WWA7" /LENGTH=471 /DNA_ID=CAMNT_0047403759 /DNA_START=183 /DNA_END=1598 /DNA_ORIENTATION=-